MARCFDVSTRAPFSAACARFSSGMPIGACSFSTHCPCTACATHAPCKMTGVAYVYAQVFGTLLLVRLIKIGCEWPRPHVATSHDFLRQAPSHAVNAAVGAMVVLVLLRSRVAALLALTAALFMALARIAIDEHYLSDVLAGIALGVTIAAVVMRIYLLPRWRSIETASTQ